MRVRVDNLVNVKLLGASLAIPADGAWRSAPRIVPVYQRTVIVRTRGLENQRTSGPDYHDYQEY